MKRNSKTPSQPLSYKRRIINWIVTILALLVLVATILLLLWVSAAYIKFVLMGTALLLLNLIFIYYFAKRNM